MEIRLEQLVVRLEQKDDYREVENLTREAFWELAKFNHPTHQIVFCTEEALRCIKFIGAEEIENGTTKK